MATTTSAKRRTKPPKEAPTDRAAKPPLAVRATIAGPLLDLPTHAIEASGFNPRVRFDDASLERLAASLREVGLIEPIVVWRRDTSGAWLVIAGERRWRAACMAGLPTVRAQEFAGDEVGARLIAALENEDREDLSAVEKARSYQGLIEAGSLTQAQVGELCGVSQPVVANRLRLLQLPDEWQQRVIRREISESHARELVSWADLPAVLAEMERALLQQYDGSPPSLVEWRDDLRDVLHRVSRPISAGCWWGPGPNGVSRSLAADLPREQWEACDVREVPAAYGEGQVHRAFDVPAWESAIAEAEKASPRKTAQKGLDGSGSDSVSPTGLSEEQRAEDRTRRREAAVLRYVEAWLRRETATRLRAVDEDDPGWRSGSECARKVLWLLLAKGGGDHRRLAAIVREAAIQRGAAPKTTRESWPGGPIKDPWGAVQTVDDARPDLFEIEVAARAVEDESLVSAREVVTIAGGSLGIELESWRPDQAWLELHTVDELDAIARKWRVADRLKSEPDTPKGSKAERIASILAGVAGQTITVPREILRAKLGR